MQLAQRNRYMDGARAMSRMRVLKACCLFLLMTIPPATVGGEPLPTDPDKQVRLGLAHIEGKGVVVDEALAAALFRSAAVQRDADGQYQLGLLYIRGAGVEKNDIEAYKWLTLAHEHGRGDALAVRDAIAGRMTPAQLQEARGLVRNWRPEPR